jgi:hypothetical protein
VAISTVSITTALAINIGEMIDEALAVVGDLRRAPELAVRAVVHTAVRAAPVALAAEHPNAR